MSAGLGRRGRRLLRHPAAREPDRGVGFATERAARQPRGARGGGPGGGISGMRARGTAAAHWSGIPARAGPDRVLEGQPVPAPRPRGVSPDVPRRRLDDRASLPLSGPPMTVTARAGRGGAVRRAPHSRPARCAPSSISASPRERASLEIEHPPALLRRQTVDDAEHRRGSIAPAAPGRALPPMRVCTQPGWSATVRKPSPRRSSASNRVAMFSGGLAHPVGVAAARGVRDAAQMAGEVDDLLPLPSRGVGEGAHGRPGADPTAFTLKHPEDVGRVDGSPPFTPETPALLTSTSTGPGASCSANAPTLASSATSSRWIRSRTPGRTQRAAARVRRRGRGRWRRPPRPARSVA